MFHDKIPVPNVVQRLIRFKESSVKRWRLLNFCTWPMWYCKQHPSVAFLLAD
jgi:hypothetical protein